MRIFVTLFIGLLPLFLNPSTSLGASTYLFDNGQCSSLSGLNWKHLGSACPKGQVIYSMKDSLHLFCQYSLKPGETLKGALIRNGFYRSKERVSVVPYSTGRAEKVISRRIEHLLFSKRDLLSNKGLCSTPKPYNLAKSAFVFHIPNSVYVIKSGLKKINAEPLLMDPEDIPLLEVNDTKASTTISKKIKNKKSNKTLNIKSVLFYDNFKGTQISNQTTAEVSSKLSPALYASMNFRENRTLQYSFSLGVNFHIYNEKVDELAIANNNVQSLHIGTSFKINHYKYFTPKLSFILFEDLYYERKSATSLQIERELVPRFLISSKLYFIRNDTFTLSIEPGFIYDLSHGPLQSGTGYKIPLEFKFIKNDYVWGFGLDYLQQDKNLTDLKLSRSILAITAQVSLRL